MKRWTLLCALCVGLQACSDEQPRPPDRVLVIVDTLRADVMTFAGGPAGTTPALDALVASEAAWFSRAYAGSSWTLPSSATLLTGFPAWTHRVTRAAEREDVYGRLPVEIPTVAAHLKAQGYRTGAWVNNVFLAPEFGLAAGFEVYDYEGALPVGHRTAVDTVAEALAWMDSDDQPAFVLIHLMEPHADYDPAPAFRGTLTEGLPHTLSQPLGPIQQEMARGRLVPSAEDQAFMRAMYLEEVMSVDFAIGRLVDGLRSRSGWDELMLVVTSDHGEEFWERGAYEHGHSLLAPVSAIPLVVKAPDFPAGQRNDTVIDPVLVHELLATGEGLLKRVAVLGTQRGHVAVGEGILYGAQAATLATDDQRLVVELGAIPRLALFDLDARGSEIWPPREDSAEAGQALLEHLVKLREGLGTTEPVNPRPVQSVEMFEALRALGYAE